MIQLMYCALSSYLNLKPAMTMFAPVTEITYLPITPSIDLELGEGKGIWQKTLETIAGQPGFKQLLWGCPD